MLISIWPIWPIWCVAARRFVVPALLAGACFAAGAEDGADAEERGSEDGQSELSQLEEVLASASRIAPVDQRVVLLDAEDLDANAFLLGVDALRGLPGFALATSGNRGALAQARVRGAEANHLLVLLDGVALNDPGSGSEFDFGALALAGIGKVEYLAGPQSAVWGSDALAGVLHLDTTPTESKRAFGVGAGSHGATQVGGDFALVGERGHAALHVQRTASDGTNASLEGDEADGFANTTAHLSLARHTSRWQFDGKARWTQSAAEYDPSPAPRFVPADGDRRADGQSRLLLGSARFLGSERLTPWFALSSVQTRRRHFAEGDWQSTVLGRRDTATLASNLTLGRQRFNATAELEAERFEQAAPATPFGNPNQRQRTFAFGIAGEYQLHLPRLGLTASVRRDFNDEFAHAFAYRVGITSLGQPRWFASVGRGVKNPTFVERFGYAPDAFVGNPDLQPETANGVEIGVAWRFDSGSLTLSTFDSALRRQIDGFFFDAERGAFTARNLRGKSERRGAELAFSANVDGCMGRARCVLRASYAYVHAENGEGMAELRRPRHLGELQLRIHLSERLRVAVGVTGTGHAYDNDYSTFPATRATLPGFRILRASVDFDASRKVRLRLAADNLLDAEYATVFGYASPGLAMLATATISL